MFIARHSKNSSRNLYSGFLQQNNIKKELTSKIDECINETLGREFLYLDDISKIDILNDLSIKQYTSKKILKKKTEEMEEEYQIALASGIIPSNIEEALPGLLCNQDINSTSLYWSSQKNHKVRAPFIRGTAQSQHLDKDESLSMLFNLIDKYRLILGDNITLIVDGCDNNEAGAKLFTYLSSFKKKVNMICTDVNLNALTRTRGLDILIQQEFYRYFGKEIESSDIISRDSFNEKDPLVIKKNIGQRIAMPFRLTAIAPLDRISGYTERLIKNNNVCVMHFFQDSHVTTETLTHNYKYSRKSFDPKTGSSYCHGNGLNISVWEEKALAAFMDEKKGQILDIKTITTGNDFGKPIQMWICVVQRKSDVAY